VKLIKSIETFINMLTFVENVGQRGEYSPSVLKLGYSTEIL